MSVQGQEHAPVARALHSCPSQQGSPVEGQAQVCLGLQAAAAQRGWVRAESSACQHRQTEAAQGGGKGQTAGVAACSWTERAGQLFRQAGTADTNACKHKDLCGTGTEEDQRSPNR